MRWSRTKPRLTTGLKDLPAAVKVTRVRHPLQGTSLRVLGGMRRHGAMELLLELPDGSKSLVPAWWTDIGTAGMDQAGSGLVTLGSLADLLRVCQLIADLRGQAAGMSPCKEDSHAACPAQFDTRPSPDPDHRSGVGGGVDADGRAATARGGRDGSHVAGQRDCQGRRSEGKRGDQR